jgi:hypothetical protein
VKSSPGPGIVVLALAGSAAAGLVVSGILLSRVVTVEQVEIPEALRRFETAHRLVAADVPLPVSGRAVEAPLEGGRRRHGRDDHHDDHR